MVGVGGSPVVLTEASLMFRRCATSRWLILLRSDTTLLSGGARDASVGVGACTLPRAGESGRPPETGKLARDCEFVDMEAWSCETEKLE